MNHTNTLLFDVQVIGIMDCQEWPDGNMTAGYQHFQQLLTKVVIPASLRIKPASS